MSSVTTILQERQQTMNAFWQQWESPRREVFATRMPPEPGQAYRFTGKETEEHSKPTMRCSRIQIDKKNYIISPSD